jgi:AcrR family transcriptional regulator
MAKIGRPLVMTVDERRSEIFNAAEKLFGEFGFEHVTMAQIASEVGMSKKTLYIHFADKKELLKALVTSSYIWAEFAFKDDESDSINTLKNRLKVSAEHVLSTRHIKLCRLAIAENISGDCFADTFYEMGIAKSRDYLIEAISNIDSKKFILNLDPEILADMLFGASITKPFIDLLMIHREINLNDIYKQIDVSVEALFQQ